MEKANDWAFQTKDSIKSAAVHNPNLLESEFANLFWCKMQKYPFFEIGIPSGLAFWTGLASLEFYAQISCQSREVFRDEKFRWKSTIKTRPNRIEDKAKKPETYTPESPVWDVSQIGIEPGNILIFVFFFSHRRIPKSQCIVLALWQIPELRQVFKQFVLSGLLTFNK